MKTRTWWAIIILLLAVIGVMAWFLILTPAPAKVTTGSATGDQTETTTGTGTGDATGSATGGSQPLSKRVTITSPKANATVEKTFIVAGVAPGPWFFEASFPIKVLDKNGNVLVNTHASAQGDWMTTELVTYTASITIANYSGPATLVLLKDNPSGLPENDDSVSVPIVIN